MKKVLNHIKNNAALYLILLLCVVILLIAIFHKEQTELETVDTSLFNVVTINQVIQMFKDSEPKFLVISKSDDQATVKYVDTLQYAMAEGGYTVYYMELDDLDIDGKDKENVKKLGELFNLNYTRNGQTKPLIDYLGETPMNVLIRNKKVVYAFIGTLNVTSLEALTKAYGITGGNNA